MSVEPPTTELAGTPRLWDATSLLGGRCSSCHAFRFPMRAVCARCQGSLMVETRLPTTGTIYSFTVVRAAPPGYHGEVPYGLGIVELGEQCGLRVTTTLAAEDLTDLAIDDAVEFEAVEGRGDQTGSFAFRRKQTV